MIRLATSFVLGFHGCDATVAERLLSGEAKIIQSERAYDWLGPGAYFWESDKQRALEFAEWRVSRGDYKKAAVVGAAIDLGNCLDLTLRQNLDLVRGAYVSLKAQQEKAGLELPINENAKGDANEDRLLRYLDCAVIVHLHKAIDEGISKGRALEPFDAVRGIFTEGGPLYEGCAYLERTHTQVAVKNPDCIKGFFRPL